MIEKVASPGAGRDELDQLVERLRSDVVRVVALDERAAAPGEREVVGGLDVEIRRAADRRRQRLRPDAEAGRVALDVVGGAAVVPGEVDDRLPDHVVRVAGVRPGPVDAEDARHGVGRAAARTRGSWLQSVLDLGRREGQDAAMEVGAERLEPELERRRDPEVPAGAAQAPEELGLLGLGRADEPAVGGDELDGGQVVDREPEVALEAADSPTERQPGDAGVADDAGRADEAVRLRGDVELAEERAAVRPGGPGPRIRPRRRASPDMSTRSPPFAPPSPAALWPPDRTVISRSCSRAKRIAVATSSAVDGRAMTAGRRSWIAFQRRRASS